MADSSQAPFRYALTHDKGANASNSGSKIEISFRWIGVFGWFLFCSNRKTKAENPPCLDFKPEQDFPLKTGETTRFYLI